MSINLENARKLEYQLNPLPKCILQIAEGLQKLEEQEKIYARWGDSARTSEQIIQEALDSGGTLLPVPKPTDRKQKILRLRMIVSGTSKGEGPGSDDIRMHDVVGKNNLHFLQLIANTGNLKETRPIWESVFQGIGDYPISVEDHNGFYISKNILKNK